MTTNDAGTLGRDEAVRAVDFLLTRIASWTSANWQQHLRFEFGDECAERMIAAIAALRDGERDARYAPDDAGEDFEALSDAAKDRIGIPFPAPPATQQPAGEAVGYVRISNGQLVGELAGGKVVSGQVLYTLATPESAP